MLVERLASTRASRSRGSRWLWPTVWIGMSLIGTLFGVFLATHG